MWGPVSETEPEGIKSLYKLAMDKSLESMTLRWGTNIKDYKGNWCSMWTKSFTTLLYWLGVTPNLKPILKTISKSFALDFRAENIVSFKEVWPWNGFERFSVFITIRLKYKVNFFNREFLEDFYFSNAFIVVIKSLI